MKNAKHISFYLWLTLYLTACMVSVAFATDGWEANLAISVSSAENRLLFGEKADGTDDLDGQYDVPPLLGGNLAAYFTNGGGNLWRDIRSQKQAGNTWKLHIESSVAHDRLVTVQWDPEDFPEWNNVTLNDVKNGVIVDMKKSNMFVYKNIGPKDLEIFVTELPGGINHE